MRMCVPVTEHKVNVKCLVTMIIMKKGLDPKAGGGKHRRNEIVVTVNYHLHIFKWSIKLLIEML